MAITTVQQVMMMINIIMMVMMIIVIIFQANNLCDLGIERDTLLELCKNFKQIPQVVI